MNITTMNITKNTVVSIHYTLTNDNGDILDASSKNEPLVYLHGSGNIIRGLEKALENKATGDQLKVSVEPEHAYGVHRKELVQDVSRDAFEGIDSLEVGMQFHAETGQGPMPITIAAINGDIVTIDGNHALAGVRLHFDVTIAGVRLAKADEISHGHVH